MAYPAEKAHLEYLQYVEDHTDGPLLSKEEWLKQRDQGSAAGDPRESLKVGPRAVSRSGLKIRQ
jgi:hypothetical protein